MEDATPERMIKDYITLLSQLTEDLQSGRLKAMMVVCVTSEGPAPLLLFCDGTNYGFELLGHVDMAHKELMDRLDAHKVVVSAERVKKPTHPGADNSH